MAQISLRFHACVIATEGVATDDEGDYFEGEVDFDLLVDGHVHRGLAAKVKPWRDERCSIAPTVPGP